MTVPAGGTKRFGRPGFVGLGAEMTALQAALERTLRARVPQAVTIVGPLGIGKTRLVDEWLAGKRMASVRVVRVRAGAEGRIGPPRALMGALLRQRFQLGGAGDDAVRGFRAELQRVFGDRRVAEVAALLGGFLGLEVPESPLVRALCSRPEHGAEVARAVLCRFLEQDARLVPLVLVAEDLHHADDESLDVMQGLLA